MMRLPASLKVDGPLPQVLAVRLRELVRHLLDDLHEDPLDVSLVFLQGTADALLQLGVVEHEKLGLEERAVPTRDKPLHLSGGLFQGGEEPPVLEFDLRGGDVVAGDGELVFQEQERFAPRDSRGRADSRELHHAGRV